MLKLDEQFRVKIYLANMVHYNYIYKQTPSFMIMPWELSTFQSFIVRFMIFNIFGALLDGIANMSSHLLHFGFVLLNVFMNIGQIHCLWRGQFQDKSGHPDHHPVSESPKTFWTCPIGDFEKKICPWKNSQKFGQGSRPNFQIFRLFLVYI